jgi:putative addiction module component (TIGR02574 family)
MIPPLSPDWKSAGIGCMASQSIPAAPAGAAEPQSSDIRGPAATPTSTSPPRLNVIHTDVPVAVAGREAENSAMSIVRKEIQSLSVADRLKLLEAIWDSLIDTPEAVPVTAAQRKELARRRRAHTRNPSAARSWAQVRARLRRRK